MARLGTIAKEEKAKTAAAQAYSPFRHAAAIHDNIAKQVNLPRPRVALDVKSDAALWQTLLRHETVPSE